MRDRLHNIYYKMRQRCNNPNDKSYPNYGGRGITYCDEWEDTKNFIEWALSNGYNDELTLDRIDPNGNYCPENCRWITIQEQQRNRRSNQTITWNNETHCYNEWDAILGYPIGTIGQRIRRGWGEEDALTRKLGDKHYNYDKGGLRKVIVIHPDGTEYSYPSLGSASKSEGITTVTLHALSTEEGQKKSRRYKGYKTIIAEPNENL